MQIESLEIRNAYAFSYESLAIYEKKIFDSLPQDYQNFLKKYNGGFVKSDYIKGETISFKTQLNFHGKDGVNKNIATTLKEFWGFISYENQKTEEGKPASILHEHFDRHLDEMFLPNGVVCIGSSVQHSLIAISLNQTDYGNIYYWEWYWRYPWYKAFFDDRIAQARSKFQNLDEILRDEYLPLIYDPPQSIYYLIDSPEQQRYIEACDALNYATLVKMIHLRTFWKDFMKKNELFGGIIHMLIIQGF